MKLTKHKLGELLDVTRGTSLSGEYFATQGDYMRLTCGNFDYQNNCFKTNTSKDNLYYTGSFNPEFLMTEGDIITPLTEQAVGLLGSTAWVPESGKYIQSQDVAKITPNKKLLDKKFCYYLISSKVVKHQLSVAAQQTKIRHTSPDKIKDCTVWIPSLEEQAQIGQFLYDIDSKIALNRQINDNLEAMAKQLYDYWFVQFDFPDENGKPYKSSSGKMVWNEKLKRNIPELWTDTTLGCICDLYQPQTLGLSLLSDDEPFKVYGANGIVGHYNKYNHEQSEIAMACRGNSCGVLNRTMPKSWITGNAMVIHLKDETINNEFIKQALKYANVKGAISGSGQPQLTRENLEVLNIIKPSQRILLLYSNVVAPLVEKEINMEKEIDRLTKQRNTLLPLLMNGQVTINYHLSDD